MTKIDGGGHFQKIGSVISNKMTNIKKKMTEKLKNFGAPKTKNIQKQLNKAVENHDKALNKAKEIRESSQEKADKIRSSPNEIGLAGLETIDKDLAEGRAQRVVDNANKKADKIVDKSLRKLLKAQGDRLSPLDIHIENEPLWNAMKASAGTKEGGYNQEYFLFFEQMHDLIHGTRGDDDFEKKFQQLFKNLIKEEENSGFNFDEKGPVKLNLPAHLSLNNTESYNAKLYEGQRFDRDKAIAYLDEIHDHIVNANLWEQAIKPFKEKYGG